MTNKYVIYCIYFKSNPKKKYIGADSYYPLRKHGHLHTLRRNIHQNKYLQRAYNKYGEAEFVHEALETCLCKKSMLQAEIRLIAEYNSYEKGFNLTTGGEGAPGRRLTDLHKKRISKGNKGKKLPEDQKKRLSELYPTSELSKNRYITTPEVRKKITIGYMKYCKKYGSPNLGRKFSDELKAKMKDRCKDKKPPWTKLNEEKVSEIKRLLILNGISIENRKKLATQFGVDLQTINSITNNKTWKHVK